MDASAVRCAPDNLGKDSAGALWPFRRRSGVRRVMKFALVTLLCCLLVERCIGQGIDVKDDLKRRFPNLHKRGLLPGLLGKRANGAPPQVGVGRQDATGLHRNLGRKLHLQLVILDQDILFLNQLMGQL